LIFITHTEFLQHSFRNTTLSRQAAECNNTETESNWWGDQRPVQLSR